MTFAVIKKEKNSNNSTDNLLTNPNCKKRLLRLEGNFIYLERRNKNGGGGPVPVLIPNVRKKAYIKQESKETNHDNIE